MILASIAGAGAGREPEPQLHAPDGFLTVPVALAMWAVTLVVLAVAVRRTNRRMDDRAVPLMGVMAAFIFAAQMFNFQVVGGTSGHLLGGVLAAVLLGPWAATLVMASVIAVQALVFSDGGLVVMGANIFNMGIIGTLGGYAIYRFVAGVLGGENRSRIPAGMISLSSRSVSCSVKGGSPSGRSSPLIRNTGGRPTLMCRSDASYWHMLNSNCLIEM